MSQSTSPSRLSCGTGEHGADSRTYKVGFSRILTELSDYYKPEWDLDMGGKELIEFFDRIEFTEKDFRSKSTIRLKQLLSLKKDNHLDNTLRLR